jgi:hypothetical protein
MNCSPAVREAWIHLAMMRIMLRGLAQNSAKGLFTQSLNRAVTGPCIAVIVIKRNVPVRRSTDDSVGNVHDRDCDKAG